MRFGRKIYREQLKKKLKEGKKILAQQRLEPVVQQLSQFYFDRARVIVRQKPDQNPDFAFAQATANHLSKSFPAWIEAEAVKRARASFDLWLGNPTEYEKKEAEEKAAAEEKARKEADAAPQVMDEIEKSLEGNSSIEILNEAAAYAKAKVGV